MQYKRIGPAGALFGICLLVLTSGSIQRASEANRIDESARADAPAESPLTVDAADVLLPQTPDQNAQLDASPSSPDSLNSTSTYFTVRADLRRCAAPLCGGHFVKRVNVPLTRCANGREQPDCYVAEIDWNGQPEVEAGLAILRGEIVAKNFGSFGNLGKLRVTESWRAANNNRPTGNFYRVRDQGIRCITFPCPTHHEAKLNSTVSMNIAGVDFSGVGVSAGKVAPTEALVSGENVPVTGPAGRMQTLKASQVYARAKAETTMKPCIRGGCSNQVCADHAVISTCEWRPEYACYQKATCERQSDGNCGFTKTRELTACLTTSK